MGEEWQEAWLSIEWRGWRIEFHETHATAIPPEHYVTPGDQVGISMRVWNDEAEEALPMKRFPEVIKRILRWVDAMLKTEASNAQHANSNKPDEWTYIGGHWHKD